MSIKSKVITFKKRKHNPDPQSYNIYIVQHQKKKNKKHWNVKKQKNVTHNQMKNTITCKKCTIQIKAKHVECHV